MGAGKSTVGAELAELLGRPFADADGEIARAAGTDVAGIFEKEGEVGFREREVAAVAALLGRDDAPVLALGGGAVLDPSTRALLARRAVCVWLDVSLAVARARIGDGAGRPLAADPAGFAQRWQERRPLFALVADLVLDAGAEPAALAAAIALGAAGRPGALDRLPELIADRRSVLVADEAVVGRMASGHGHPVALRGGEEAKSLAALESLWRTFAGAELERGSVVVAAGGGTVTDVAGFAAASFARGIAWIAVPSTLVGQVDAAIGGKTGINVAAKNDVGAFHLPEATLLDPDLLRTLSDEHLADGMAEVVKTALIAGGPLWELVRELPSGRPPPAVLAELVGRCAGVKALVVSGDPTERGSRAILNLGHTIGHGIEAAAGYGELSHGRAVAVGLVAALRLSQRHAGLPAETVSEVTELLARLGLPARAPGVEADAVLAAMRHDKKRAAGEHRFVLLAAPGRPQHGVAVPESDVGEAIDGAVRPAPAP